jgi:hypothetical protein
MSDRADGKWRRWATWIVVAAPILYVLSLGPAYWLVAHYPAWGFVTPFYGPLQRALSYCPAADTAMFWYLGFWVETLHP